MRKLLIYTFLTIFFIPCIAYIVQGVNLANAEERSVTIKPKEKRDLAVEAKKGLDPALLNTKYHAIIIGNNNYKNLPKLKTAIADAKSVDELLKNQYGFETKLLLDATRNEILTTVNDFRKRLGSKDNLLIYYAGHGEFDKTADRAYWLPVNAQRDDPVDWISATDITDNIKRIASAHILIISDSCYSGTLTRAAAGDLSTKGERDEFVKKMMERKSRTLMASGGNEPVTDEGGSGHSVFADSLLRALKEADKGIFTAEELFHGRVKSSVAGKSEQVPEYNDIKNSGHDGGDFVFKLASLSSAKEDVTLNLIQGQKGSPSPEVSEEMKRLEEEKERLKKEREELEQKKALMEEKNHLEEDRRKLEKEKLELASLPPPPPQVESKPKLAEKDNMVLIPAGEFMAGSPSSLKGMVLSEFYIDKYEVTQREFEQVMGKNPSYFKDCPNCPVEQVTWYEADEYCRKVGKRLPIEWEWERAAKAGTTTTYYWGESESMADSYAWYRDNSNTKTHPVGQKNPNNYGLYDMAGNVSEWTSSDYDSYKVFRGGSWGIRARFLIVTDRPGFYLNHRGVNDLGFRCIASASGQSPTSVQPKIPLSPPFDKGEVGGLKDNMVLIPAGEFMAGEPKSLKGMDVSAFYIDKYEVTQREYEQVMGKNPSSFKGSDRPVERVTWYEADEYCRKVGKRLPTEWEWEKAAKAGTTTTFYWGNSESMAYNYAWYQENSGKKATHPVGQKKPNAYGLYDMAGNVWEWTSSNYDDIDKDKYKVLRGGSWNDNAKSSSLSRRSISAPDNRGAGGGYGFRCVQ